MFYDNLYVLGDLFHRFLLDNPDIQNDGFMADSNANLHVRLEEWLERETDVTDLSHQATMMQLASSYEALVELRDTLATSTGL